MVEKPCSKCKIVKLLEEFNNSNKEKSGRRSECRACEKAAYHLKRQSGICSSCGKTGITTSDCSDCQQVKNERSKQRRVELKSKGLCIVCAIKPSINKNFCVDCNKIKLDKQKTDPKRKVWSKRTKLKTKDKVFNHYGGYICRCCGETTKQFLSIDHIHGGGEKHRKEIGRSETYRWLVKNNFPEGYQVLCMNCQFGRRMNNGICPHKLQESIEFQI